MKYKKQIIPLGEQEVTLMDGTRKKVNFTRERVKTWVENHLKMKENGLRTPAPWRHDPEATPRMKADSQDHDAFQNAGWWEDYWQAEDGSLWGEVDVPLAADMEKVGNTVKEVSPLILPEWKDSKGNVYKDVILHTALVNHPQLAGQPNFEPVTEGPIAAGMAFSSEGMLLAAGDVSSSSGNTDGTVANTTSPRQPVKASGASIQDALKVLEQLGLTLPDDTTSENLLERIIVAGNAVNNSKSPDGESMHDVPEGAKTRPQPIAMSGESQMAIPKFDAFTGKPLTAEQIAELEKKEAEKGVQLSAEQEASINWATKTATEGYRTRIKNLIPKVGKEYAEKHLLPLLEGMQLSFNAAGEPVAGPLDTVLASLEAAPDHLKARRTSQAGVFSLSASGISGMALDSEPPEGSTVLDSPDLDQLQVSDEDAEKVVDQIMSGNGRSDLVSGKLQLAHGEVIGNPAQ